MATANNFSSLSLSNCSWALWSRPFQDSGLAVAQAQWPGTPWLTSPGQIPLAVGQSLVLEGRPTGWLGQEDGVWAMTLAGSPGCQAAGGR